METNMTEKFKIGIVGHGFVGKAVDYGFTHPNVEKFYVDPNYNTTIDDLVKWEPNLTFICAPTPMMEDGSIDAAIVNDAVLKLVQHTNSLVAIKSTVTPDVIKNLMVTITFKQAIDRVVYNPEFLTEANAKYEFVNPEFHIFGGTPIGCSHLINAYGAFSMCKLDKMISMSPVEASFAKYAINTFLATKVTFFNQLYDAATSMDANFSNIIRGIESDSRIGSTHMKVPGFDGKRGFGGACFPKDTKALSKSFKDFTLIDDVIKINNNYRSQYELDEREKEQNVSYG